VPKFRKPCPGLCEDQPARKALPLARAIWRGEGKARLRTAPHSPGTSRPPGARAARSDGNKFRRLTRNRKVNSKAAVPERNRGNGCIPGRYKKTGHRGTKSRHNRRSQPSRNWRKFQTACGKQSSKKSSTVLRHPMSSKNFDAFQQAIPRVNR